MPVQEDSGDGTDELQICCGQFLASDRDHEHRLCDGEEDSYGVGGWLLKWRGVLIEVVGPDFSPHLHKICSIRTQFIEQS